GSGGSVRVQAPAAAGTARDGIDFVAASSTLTFLDGQTTASFTVTLKDDTEIDGKRTVLLTLGSATGASLGSPASAVLMLMDDEQVPTVPPPVTPPSAAPPGGGRPLTGDVTGLGTIAQGAGGRKGPKPNRFKQRVSITNSTGRDLAGPLSLLVPVLPRGVRLVRVTSSGGDAGLIPAGTSVTYDLEFLVPVGRRVKYTPQVTAG